MEKVFTTLSDLGFEKKEFDITELFFICGYVFKNSQNNRFKEEMYFLSIIDKIDQI